MCSQQLDNFQYISKRSVSVPRKRFSLPSVLEHIACWCGDGVSWACSTGSSRWLSDIPYSAIRPVIAFIEFVVSVTPSYRKAFSLLGANILSGLCVWSWHQQTVLQHFKALKGSEGTFFSPGCSWSDLIWSDLTVLRPTTLCHYCILCSCFHSNEERMLNWTLLKVLRWGLLDGHRSEIDVFMWGKLLALTSSRQVTWSTVYPPWGVNRTWY